MAVVVVDGGIFDGSVHALDLAVGPGMVGSGKRVSDDVTKTDATEGMPTKAGGWSFTVRTFA